MVAMRFVPEDMEGPGLAASPTLAPVVQVPPLWPLVPRQAFDASCLARSAATLRGQWGGHGPGLRGKPCHAAGLITLRTAAGALYKASFKSVCRQTRAFSP